MKIPGTYPETALTNAKQFDGELKLVATMLDIAPRISLAAGAGYKLRLGGVKDEITFAAAVPVAVASAVTLAATVSGGIAVGPGDVARNAITPGASVRWRLRPELELSGAYYRTVVGRNVVQADVVTLGLTASL